jgi:T5orf172 domain
MKICKNCQQNDIRTAFAGNYNYCTACYIAYKSGRKNERNRSVRPTVVYFIKSADLIKIGYTGDLTERVRTLQVNNPTIVEVLKTIPGGYQEERQLHKQFAHLNKTGEWFYAAQELLDFIGTRPSDPLTTSQ